MKILTDKRSYVIMDKECNCIVRGTDYDAFAMGLACMIHLKDEGYDVQDAINTLRMCYSKIIAKEVQPEHEYGI